ncbi:uncharacterized protein LOC120271707 isoform X2 [Dioscorea cayenensis subsp. rotundata]|uniref:Vacuolar ATPase assembly protein VMA22 n=1 Tax=Dioscorea cayennensis subsp. rotundata TaxID=55577 RepID=A0AB40C3I0_DIOCR|nr:uncharacterized protein LOC120271707 isoform X2 [Dioscorea cayenensis subsp. rotundata]
MEESNQGIGNGGGGGGEEEEIETLRFLDSLDGYVTLLNSLSSILRQGWLELASARHSMGSSACINCHCLISKCSRLRLRVELLILLMVLLLVFLDALTTFYLIKMGIIKRREMLFWGGRIYTIAKWNLVVHNYGVEAYPISLLMKKLALRPVILILLLIMLFRNKELSLYQFSELWFPQSFVQHKVHSRPLSRPL